MYIRIMIKFLVWLRFPCLVFRSNFIEFFRTQYNRYPRNDPPAIIKIICGINWNAWKKSNSKGCNLSSRVKALNVINVMDNANSIAMIKALMLMYLSYNLHLVITKHLTITIITSFTQEKLYGKELAKVRSVWSKHIRLGENNNNNCNENNTRIMQIYQLQCLKNTEWQTV